MKRRMYNYRKIGVKPDLLGDITNGALIVYLRTVRSAKRTNETLENMENEEDKEELKDE